jgi:subfamily B ATP-binding cassette protein MsbA
MFFKKISRLYPALFRLAKRFASHRLQVGAILFLGLVVAAIQPATVRLSERMISEIQKGQGIDPDIFRTIPFFLVGLFLVSGFAKYFYNTLRRILSESIIAEYREELYKKYLALPVATIDKKRTGELLSGLQNDLVQISSGIDTMSVVLKEPFTFIGLMAVAFYCEWRLTLATLLVAPLVAFLFSRTGSAVKRYSEKNLRVFSDLMSLGQESLVGARIVKVFGLESVLTKQFQAIQNTYLSTIKKSIRVQELATPLVELVGAFLIAGVVFYAGALASQGNLTSGQLVGFIIAIGLAQMPIKELNNSFLKLKNAEAAAERLYEILDEAEVEYLTSGKVRISQPKEGIVFNEVSLSYRDGKKAIDKVSFKVKMGETVALVGSSGSGKTSVVNLLPRLYEMTSGDIFIDGNSIREFLLGDLRNLFAFVTQDTFLFHDTIGNNIRYGNPRASLAEIEKACELAFCSDFIRKLPQGLNSLVGDRGVMLSGGERQRVAIARAFLRNAPILVLDEATSNLDSRSEVIVQKALQELVIGKTTFMIAHRLSTVRTADQILVFENGKLLESGSHEELVNRQSHYHEALSLQI